MKELAQVFSHVSQSQSLCKQSSFGDAIKSAVHWFEGGATVRRILRAARSASKAHFPRELLHNCT